MLDAVVDYMPSPLDVPAIKGTKPGHPGIELERHASDDEPFSALAFKIMTRPVRRQTRVRARVLGHDLGRQLHL